MRRREYYWSLFHSAEQKQIDHLRTDQVETIFAVVPPRMHAEFYVWREGLPEWKVLSDFPQQLQALRKGDNRIFETPPPPPNSYDTETSITKTPAESARLRDQARIGSAARTSVSIELGEEDEAVPLAIDDRVVVEDRDHKRFEKKFDVRFPQAEPPFMTVTLDISLSGMQLREPVPPGIPNVFRVEIRKGTHTIPVMCSAIRSHDGSPSRKLRIEKNEFADALLSLLLSTT